MNVCPSFSLPLFLSLFLSFLLSRQESIGIQPCSPLSALEIYLQLKLRAGVYNSMELLKNFSRNFTDEQLTNDAVLRITAATCCIVCVMVLVILSVCAKCYSRITVCGTTIKRLAVGLSVANLLFELVAALHLVCYFHPELKEVKHLCEFEGFLAKCFASVQVLLALDVCLVLFLEMLKASLKLKLECYEKVKRSNSTCCKRKINKLEIAIFASAFAFPLLFDWIPFTTNSYGPSIEGVCWFCDQNCSQNTLCTAELWEQIWLLTVPVGFVGVLIMLIFTVALSEWTGGH